MSEEVMKNDNQDKIRHQDFATKIEKELSGEIATQADVPEQLRSYSAGPAAVQTILNCFGAELPSDLYYKDDASIYFKNEVARYLNDSEFDNCGLMTYILGGNKATYLPNMMNVLAALGCNTGSRIEPVNDADKKPKSFEVLKAAGIDLFKEVAEAVDAGNVVLMSYANFNSNRVEDVAKQSRIVVISGYKETEDAKFIKVKDPKYRIPEGNYKENSFIGKGGEYYLNTDSFDVRYFVVIEKPSSAR